MDSLLDVGSLKKMARRRFWHFLIPATVVVVGFTAYTLSITPLYTSFATIEIEDQNIPENLVRDLIDDFVDQRLDSINRRIIVSENLIELIERHDLYTDLRDSESPAAVAGEMRQNISMDKIRSTFNTGSKFQTATVAFRVAFEYEDPQKAQRVTNELVSLFLEFNLQERREIVEETGLFFQRERERLEAEIDELEQEIAEFRLANSDFLPDKVAQARSQLERYDAQLLSLTEQNEELLRREEFLKAELETIGSVGAPNVVASQAAALRTRLALALATYSPDHPTVRRLTRELEVLQNEAASIYQSREEQRGASEQAMVTELERREAELAALRDRYSDQHPDVVRAERELERVRTVAEQTVPGNNADRMVMSYKSQLNTVQNQLSGIEIRREQLAQLIAEAEGVMEAGGEIQLQLGELYEGVNQARARRNELIQKESVIRMGQALETEAAAERFSLVEPPRIPPAPSYPDLEVFLAIGFLLAMAAGAGTATAAELLDQSIRSERQIEATVGDRPLVVVPHFKPRFSKTTKVWLRVLLLVGVLLAIGIGLYLVHTRYLPLDILVIDLQGQVMGILR